MFQRSDPGQPGARLPLPLACSRRCCFNARTPVNPGPAPPFAPSGAPWFQRSDPGQPGARSTRVSVSA